MRRQAGIIQVAHRSLDFIMSTLVLPLASAFHVVLGGRKPGIYSVSFVFTIKSIYLPFLKSLQATKYFSSGKIRMETRHVFPMCFS
jgi:hypothetical protein